MLEDKLEEINDIVKSQDQNYQKVKAKFKKLKTQYKQIKQVSVDKTQECEEYK